MRGEGITEVELYIMMYRIQTQIQIPSLVRDQRIDILKGGGRLGMYTDIPAYYTFPVR